MKRRAIAMLLAATLLVGAAGCGGGGNNTGNTSSNNSNNSTTSNNNATTSNSSGSQDSGGQATTDANASSGDAVTLTYADWNLGTAEENKIPRRMVNAFNQNNANIQIQLAEDVDYAAYESSLTTLAAAGSLPDIIMLSNIPTAYTNKWLADVTDVVAADSEWDLISKNLRDSVMVNGRVVAIPSAMHLFGAIINEDAFEAANVPVPTYGISLDDFETALKNVNQPQNGIVAIKYEGDMVNWLPTALNKSLGYFTFDGSQYHLDSPEVLSSFRKINGYRSDRMTFKSLTDEQLQNFQSNKDADWEAWSNGEAAVTFDGTWAVADKNLSFDISFMGLPNNFSVIIGDFFAVTKTCSNPTEAVEFMKWMSYGKDGFMQKIAFAKEDNTNYFSMPIIQDDELLAAFGEFLSVPGLMEAYQDLDGAIVEPVKTIPGYINSRWDAETGIAIPDAEGNMVDNAKIGSIIEAAAMRGYNFADVASQINSLANSKYTEYVASMQ